MDGCDHLRDKPKGVGDEAHLLFDIHRHHPLSELYQQADAFSHVHILKERAVLLEGEEDLGDDDAEAEVEDVVLELTHVELVVCFVDL